MHKGLEGFSVVIGLILLLVVSVISITGWHVLSTNAAKTSPINKTTQQQSSAAAIPSDWTTYQNDDLSVSFAYPKTWTFVDQSKTQTSTKAYFLGELISSDKSTTAAIRLTRKIDGRTVYSTIQEWKAYANTANINYSNLTEVNSSNTAFGYTYDVSGATGLVYQILSPSNNVEIVVLPADSNDKPTIEKIVTTLQFEK